MRTVMLLGLLAACSSTPRHTAPPTSAPATCEPSACGPRMGLKNTQCPDGKTVAGPTGRCLRHDDGTCGWEVLSCP